MSEFSRCPPAVLDYSKLVQWTSGSLADLDDSCHGTRSCGFDQLSRGSRAGFQVPAGLIRSPGLLGPVSEVLQC